MSRISTIEAIYNPRRSRGKERYLHMLFIDLRKSSRYDTNGNYVARLEKKHIELKKEKLVYFLSPI